MQKEMENARIGYYDMEIMNSVFGRTCKVLEQREFGLLSGVFRAEGGGGWVRGSRQEVWDPEVVRKQARVVHFSDSPLVSASPPCKCQRSERTFSSSWSMILIPGSQNLERVSC